MSDVNFRYIEVVEEGRYSITLKIGETDYMFSRQTLNLDREKKVASAPLEILLNKGLIGGYV